MNIIGRYACCAGLGLLGLLPATAQRSLEGNNKIATGAQPLRFTLEGTLKDLPVQPAKMYLIYDTLSGKPMDSAVVVNGKYKFTGVINEPVMVTISPKASVEKLDFQNTAKFFLDKGTIKATSTGHIHNLKVTGSAAADAFVMAHKPIRMFEDSAQMLAKFYRETQDRFYFDRVMLRAFSMERPLIDAYAGYIKTHPNAVVNPYLVNALMDCMPKASPGTADSLLAMFNRMPAKLREGATGKRAYERLNNEMKIAIGHKAPEFTLPASNGENVSLAALKGKYVLMFFQNGTQKNASEVELANAMSVYKAKGLVMICVGMGADKQSWQNDVAARNTPWMNVWAGKEMETLYGISSDRPNLLIDPAGNIIARNLGGSNLNRTLSDVMD